MMGIPLHVNRNENDSSINRKPTQINQTRLAAVSNYKLAQLTFSPPKDFTLRKTALVKNLVEIVYQHTLNDYLTKPMTRWTFFTPESLEDMTQKDVEKVIYRYTQIIHNTAVAFEKKHIKKEQQFLLTDFPEKQQLLLEQQVHEQEQLVNALMEANGNDDEEKVLQSYYSTLFLQPNSIFSNESLEQDCSLHSLQQGDYDDETDSSFDSEKESATSDVKKESRTTLSEAFKEDNKHNINEMFTSPTHNFGSLIITSTNPSSIETNTTSNNTSATGNRLSWLSDTGVPTTSLALNLASELMSLFDMEFNVDLTIPDLRRFEGNNSSTTSLNQVYNMNDFSDDIEGEEDTDDQFAQQIIQGSEHVPLFEQQPLHNTEYMPDQERDRKSPEKSRASILRELFEDSPITHHYIAENEKKKQQQQQQQSSKKVVAVPTLKHLAQKPQQRQADLCKGDSFDEIENNSSNHANSSTDNISFSSSSVLGTPSPGYSSQQKHILTGTPSLSPSTFTTSSQTSRYYSSSLSSESENEEEIIRDIDLHHEGKAINEDNEDGSGLQRRNKNYSKNIIPPNRISSLEYRRSLAGIFDLSDDESESTASYLNDSTDGLRTGIYAAREGSTPVHKGFNVTKNSCRKSSSVSRTSATYGSDGLHQQRSSSSLSQQITFEHSALEDNDASHHFSFGADYTQSLISPSDEWSSAFDTTSMMSTDSKRKTFPKKMAQFFRHASGRRRGSSSLSTISYNPSIRSLPLTNPPPQAHHYDSSVPAVRESSSIPSPSANSAEGFFPEDDNISITRQQYKYRHSPPHSSPNDSKYLDVMPTENKGKRTAYSSIISDSSSTINWVHEAMHKPRSPSESLGHHHFPHYNSSSDTSFNTTNSSKSTFVVMSRDSSRLSQSSKSSSSSAMNFLKRLSFHKKDKKLQRA